MSEIQTNKISPATGTTLLLAIAETHLLFLQILVRVYLTGSSQNLLSSNASYGIYLGVNSATASNICCKKNIWSPALGNFGGSNESFIDPRYTKIGRLVTVSCQLLSSDGYS